ncbi:MAG: hypothetical protein ACTSV7_14565 [Candidatus Baldrarchaeia archaeon]
MSAWDLIRKSAKRKGMVEEERIPSLRDTFMSPLVDEKRKVRKVVKHITELAELATYISNGCQMGLGIKEIRKALNKFTKKYEDVCNVLNIKSSLGALMQLEVAYDNWSRNPDNLTAQYNLVDAISRILDTLKNL